MPMKRMILLMSCLLFSSMNFSNYEAYIDCPNFNTDDTCDYVTTCVSEIDKVIEILGANDIFSNEKDFYDFVDFVLERMELVSDAELKRMLFFFFIYLVTEYEKHKEIGINPTYLK